MKIINTVIIFTFLSAFTLLFLLGYWLVFPSKTVEFKDPAFPVLIKEVKQGGYLVYLARACKYLDRPTQISRSFANDLIFNTPPILSSRPKGCFEESVYVRIPDELPPGKYYLRSTFFYKVNPIKTVSVVQNTEEFTVLEKDK